MLPGSRSQAHRWSARLPTKIRRKPDFEPQKVPDLGAQDNDGDSTGEAGDHGVWDELDQATQLS